MKWDRVNRYCFTPARQYGYTAVSLELITPNDKMDELKNLLESDKCIVEARKLKIKRSLSANAYCWVVCDALAKVLHSTKEDVYRTAIRNVGVWDTIAVKPFAYDSFRRKWESHGIGWCVDIESRHRDYWEIRVYTGSSLYTKEQMSRLLEWLVDEAERQHLDVKTPEERKKLIDEWERERYED